MLLRQNEEVINKKLRLEGVEERAVRDFVEGNANIDEDELTVEESTA